MAYPTTNTESWQTPYEQPNPAAPLFGSPQPLVPGDWEQIGTRRCGRRSRSRRKAADKVRRQKQAGTRKSVHLTPCPAKAPIGGHPAERRPRQLEEHGHVPPYVDRQLHRPPPGTLGQILFRCASRCALCAQPCSPQICGAAGRRDVTGGGHAVETFAQRPRRQPTPPLQRSAARPPQRPLRPPCERELGYLYLYL